MDPKVDLIIKLRVKGGEREEERIGPRMEKRHLCLCRDRRGTPGSEQENDQESRRAGLSRKTRPHCQCYTAMRPEARDPERPFGVLGRGLGNGGEREWRSTWLGSGERCLGYPKHRRG